MMEQKVKTRDLSDEDIFDETPFRNEKHLNNEDPAEKPAEKNFNSGTPPCPAATPNSGTPPCPAATPNSGTPPCPAATPNSADTYCDPHPPQDPSQQEHIDRYKKLIAESEKIVGEGGIERLIKTPLLYGISAALIFFGLMLWTARASVIVGMFAVLTGLPVLGVAVVLFIKLEKAAPLLKEADRLRTKIEKSAEIAATQPPTGTTTQPHPTETTTATQPPTGTATQPHSAETTTATQPHPCEKHEKNN